MSVLDVSQDHAFTNWLLHDGAYQVSLTMKSMQVRRLGVYKVHCMIFMSCSTISAVQVKCLFCQLSSPLAFAWCVLDDYWLLTAREVEEESLNPVYGAHSCHKT